MVPTNDTFSSQDRALRQALLEILPDLAIKNGIDPSVTETMAIRLQLPSQMPDFIPEEPFMTEDVVPNPNALQEEEGTVPAFRLLGRLEEQLSLMEERLRQLTETESMGQKELTAMRRAFREFSSVEKDSAADRILLSIIRMLDSVEAALHPEDEERIKFLRQHDQLPAAGIAHHYMTEMQGVRQDLLEILYQNDTEPFTCGGNTLDPLRQNVQAYKTAAYVTDDPAGEMRLESRRPGYARGDHILRKEQVWAIRVPSRWIGEELENGQHSPPEPL